MNPFKSNNQQEPEAAKVIQATLQFRDQLQALDPWLPFPQNSCCYSFGAEKRPLPIGALLLLWDTWPEATGACPECGGMAYAIGFGGLLSTGGVIAVCAGCAAGLFRRMGDLITVGSAANAFLFNTPYRLGGGVFGGCVRGERRPLIEALVGLSATELPNEEWLSGHEPSAASIGIVLPSRTTPALGEGRPTWIRRIKGWLRRR